MANKIKADASPEKRLFISLITRDISLVDAFLDIVDNSINAALVPLADQLATADGYERLLTNARRKPKVTINITASPDKIVVEDNAAGISLEMARNHVFKFGRAESDQSSSDRLSVYGIGLKRAMFKCGNNIHITSHHVAGGFELKLDVQNWSKLMQEHWTFDIEPLAKSENVTGTRIVITDLYENMTQRLDDGVFIDQLRDKIARTYSFFLGRIIEINVNGKAIPKETFQIGQNYSSYKFTHGNVSCSITAGISTEKFSFRDRDAGWFIFCNGRAVLSADKSHVTGWTGGGTGLPIFQPKHRPFIGTVFFVSTDPEALPWTTTKSSLNEDSAVWQQAKRHMVSIGRIITGFLDKRYTDEGTEVAPSEVHGASGKALSILVAAARGAREFMPPKKTGPKEQTIQYKAKIEDVRSIENYLNQPGMGGSQVGRYTFKYFLENEVR